MSPYLVGERYQLIDRVGSGGAGIVHTALDLHTGDRVAIKELHEEHRSDPVLLARFRQEAQLLRDLNHPNIVKMLELIADERFYIVMEYVEGGTLADLIGRQAPMPVEQAVGIALELADALARAHHLNVIHRDVKPANVLMAYGNVPRLTDFGIAHLMDITAQGGSDTLQGTFKYMSPESFHSVKPGVYTDSWSFGVVLYEMLTGSTPYQATSPGELVSAILTQPIPPVTASRPDLPEELARLLAGLLERDHTRRVASMRQIAARLESIQKGHVTDSTADLDVRGKPTQSIPTPRTSFIGRTRELAEIADQLADPGCRLLTLIGPGGMGKTRLALQTAIDHADAYPDGVYFVPLAPVERPAFIAAAVAEALPYVFVGGGDVEGQVIDFLREKTVLLVLDNAEHLVDDMHFPAAMLEAAPRLTILATSRRRLDISGEWLYPVRGLHYPQHPHDPDVTGFSAVRLFAERARAAAPDFDLNAELPAVLAVCRALDGMPLAIELAASWRRMLPTGAIRAEIERSLDFLHSTATGVPPRHRSLQGVFEHSWLLLDEDERAAFCRLSVFQAAFDREAAAAIAGADLHMLSRLVDHSLIQQTASGRFEMLASIRQYAAQKLHEQPYSGRTRRAYAEYYLGLAQRLGRKIKGPQQAEMLARISSDVEHIRAAWRMATANRSIVLLEQAADTLWFFHEMRSQFVEGLHLFEAAARAFAGHAEAHTMRLYNRLKARQGWFLYRLGDYQQAEDLVAACVRTARAVQAEDEVAFGLDILGPLAYHRGDYSMAAQYMETSRKLRRRLGDTWGESVALNNLGAVTFTLGNIEKARQLHEECLALKLPTGDPWLLAYTYNHLGRVAFAQERYEDARMHFQECINQATRIDYRLLIAGTHQNIGRIHLGTGQPEAARDSLQRAVAILESIGDGCGTAQALGYLGEAHYQLNHLAAAQHVLQRGLRLARICDSPPLILDIITRLAIINGDTGPADAVEILTMVTMQTHTPQHTLELAQSLLEGLRDQLSEPDFQAAADRGRRGSTSAAVDRLTA